MRIIRLIRHCTKGRTDASACASGRNQQLVFNPQVNIPGSVPAALDGKGAKNSLWLWAQSSLGSRLVFFFVSLSL